MVNVANTRLRSLPAQPTLLIGREADVEIGIERLARPEVRLLTLLGSGGVGKTRLALAIAEQAVHARARACVFVDLAAIRDADEVLVCIAESLGIATSQADSIARQIADTLGREEWLLLLDNFEHVIGAAPQIAELLSASHGLKCLVTSREPLRVRWEHRFVVHPLAVPDHQPTTALEDLGEIPSVKLFLERARAVDGRFQLSADNAAEVAAICRRLEGLPLAIELAAARVEWLAPDVLLERLDRRLSVLTRGPRDAPRRHQTLLATLDWSFDLLGAEEQRVFRCMGVFANGATRRAIEAVCGAPDVEATLESLIARHLVVESQTRSGEIRFGMLDTVAEFANYKLDAAGERETASALHAQHFVGLVEAVAGIARCAERFDRLEMGHDNLRAALRYLSAGQVGSVLRLAAGLGEFWWTRGHLGEGHHWLALALDRAAHAEPRERIKLLFWDARIALRQRDLMRALCQYTECLALQREVGDEAGAAVTMQALAMVTMVNQPAEAAVLLRESIAVHQRMGTSTDIPLALSSLSLASRLQGDLVSAIAESEQGVSIGREVGDTYGTALALVAQALSDLDLGRTERAARAVTEALDLLQGLGDRWGVALALDVAARIASSGGQFERAGRLYGASEELLRQIGGELTPPVARGQADHVRRMRSGLGASFAATRAEGAALSIDQAVAYASASEDARTTATNERPEIESGATAGLTRREHEVAALVAQGLSNRQIAEALVISEATATVHVKHILGKLRFGSRAQIAAMRWRIQQSIA